jgi:DNA-binding IclR family transcriptional regulator
MMDLKSEVRVLGLFEMFAAFGRPMQISELAEHLGAPVSSCFKLVRAVEERGYLYSARARGALYPTRRLYDLGKAILENDVLSPRIRRRIAELRDRVGETVCLAQRRDKEVVFLEVMESTHSIRFSMSVGDTRAVHANATGKAILSTLPAGEFQRVLESLSYERFTPNTLATAEALAADIERGRARGWYGNAGETVADALAMAVPVRIGADWYGLAIVGPTYRVEPELSQHLNALFEAARDIGQEGQ